MVSILGLWVCLLIQANTGFACTRILWNTNKQGVFVARTMDFSSPFGERIVVYPRGMKMKGMPGENPATWVSRYGIVGILPYDLVQTLSKSLPKSLDPLRSCEKTQLPKPPLKRPLVIMLALYKFFAA